MLVPCQIPPCPLLPEAKQEGRLSGEISHDYELFISFVSALDRRKSD